MMLALTRGCAVLLTDALKIKVNAYGIERTVCEIIAISTKKELASFFERLLEEKAQRGKIR